MRVVFAAPSLRESSARLRLRNLLPALASEGIEADALEIPSGTTSRFAFFRDLRRADAVVLHRKLLNPLEFAFLRRCARRLVFDFDDAVMFRDPFRGAPCSIRRSGRFSRTARGCHGIVAGNAYLLALAREAGASGPACVLPTPVDLSRFPAAGPREGGPFRLGWIGQASTLPYLQDLGRVFEGIALARPGISLRVIADAFPSFGALPVEACPWSEEEEPRLLAGIDVGLMPLRDDPWSRGKCGYKILQYFAAGKPVIASPVGVNADLVVPGRNGILARGAGEWTDAILRLADNPEERVSMGRQGVQTLVSGGYTLPSVASRLAAFLRSIV
jgi:glycosyltransferase involved in cell wall biosynthesis